MAASLAGKRLVITTQVFPPEIHPTAVMAAELAEGLVRRGWAVTVACGLPHHPTGELHPGYGGRLRRVEERGGVRVIRVWHPTRKSRAIASRAFVMVSQMLATGLAAASAGRPGVVLSFGGPPLVGPCLSGLLAGAWGVPLVSVIHDIYPDVAAETGSVRSPLVLGPARLLERLQYRLSRRLVVLGEASRATLVEKGVPEGRIDVLPVWLDPDEIRPGPRDNAWRAEQGIGPDRFVVLYSGTSGIVSGAGVLAEVAARLPPEVVILVVGGGEAWRRLGELGRAGRLPPNLLLRPYQPRERLPEVQAASDLSLVTLLPGKGRTSVPSKVQGYMAAGRPVLAAVDADCDTARLVARGRFGEVVPFEAAAIAAAIERARAAPGVLAEQGRRAREVFVREHAREPLLDRYHDLLSSAAGGPGPIPADAP